MISSIRTWMFNRSLRGHSNYNLKRDFSGVNLCKTYCIIASANQASASIIEKYKKRLETQGKSVDVLYFQNNKSTSDQGYSRQHIKWNGIPQHERIDAILAKEYDLLMYLYPEMEDHLRYLAILCNAKFKIGPSFEDCIHIFDLLIESRDLSNTEKFIGDIEKQLKQIST